MQRPLCDRCPRATAPPGSISPAASGLRSELAARLASAVPSLTEKIRDERARDYETARGHKAQAASQDPPGTWRSTGRPTPENAETASLEQCQVFFGKPCVLLAVNEVVQPVPKDGNWTRRDMPRARYAGAFDASEIPGAEPGVRERTDITNYRSAPSPKAAAYHPNRGRVFTIAGAGTQRVAEEEALKDCNADPDRNGADGACFLYAIVDQVILPRRSKDPLTAATPLRDLVAARLASALPGQASKSARRRPAHTRLLGAIRPKLSRMHPAGLWRAADRPTPDNAVESALENCQIVHGEPCVLLAIDDAVQPLPADGNWPRRDMPRATYASSFDAAQIPGALPGLREQADILGYPNRGIAQGRGFSSERRARFHCHGCGEPTCGRGGALRRVAPTPYPTAQTGGACYTRSATKLYYHAGLSSR